MRPQAPVHSRQRRPVSASSAGQPRGHTHSQLSNVFSARSSASPRLRVEVTASELSHLAAFLTSDEFSCQTPRLRDWPRPVTEFPTFSPLPLQPFTGISVRNPDSLCYAVSGKAVRSAAVMLPPTIQSSRSIISPALTVSPCPRPPQPLFCGNAKRSQFPSQPIAIKLLTSLGAKPFPNPNRLLGKPRRIYPSGQRPKASGIWHPPSVPCAILVLPNLKLRSIQRSFF